MINFSKKYDLENIEEENLLQVILNAVPAPMFYKDEAGRYLGCNKAFEEYLGKSRDEIVGKELYEVFPKEIADIYLEADKALFEDGTKQVYETKICYADGSLRDVVFHKAIFYAHTEQVRGIVGVIWDITKRKKAEERLHDIAHRDCLTGLANRYSLNKSLSYHMRRAQKFQHSIGLMILDLDNFKYVNDTYGHLVGDALLRKAADRLTRCVNQQDILARLGGDEFAIVINNVQQASEVQRVASDIIRQIAMPFSIDGHQCYVGTSIGIAIFPQHADSLDLLMKRADDALYQAKGDGKNRSHLSELISL